MTVLHSITEMTGRVPGDRLAVNFSREEGIIVACFACTCIVHGK